MRKFMAIIAFLGCIGIYAQTNFGVKAGLNYGDNGDVEIQDFSNSGEDAYYEQGESKTGYHFGAFVRTYLTDALYLRPEIIYTQTKSAYRFPTGEADYHITKLDLPVLVGLKIVGPLHVFAGPSFQYILENDLDGIDMGDVENEFTVGAQFGAGVQLGSIGIDARYERGFTENEASVLDIENTLGAQRIDTRPSQFILSLSLDF